MGEGIPIPREAFVPLAYPGDVTCQSLSQLEFRGGLNHLALGAVALDRVPDTGSERVIFTVGQRPEDHEKLTVKAVPEIDDLADLFGVLFKRRRIELDIRSTRPTSSRVYSVLGNLTHAAIPRRSHS